MERRRVIDSRHSDAIESFESNDSFSSQEELITKKEGGIHNLWETWNIAHRSVLNALREKDTLMQNIFKEKDALAILQLKMLEEKIDLKDKQIEKMKEKLEEKQTLNKGEQQNNEHKCSTPIKRINKREFGFKRKTPASTKSRIKGLIAAMENLNLTKNLDQNKVSNKRSNNEETLKAVRRNNLTPTIRQPSFQVDEENCGIMENKPLYQIQDESVENNFKECTGHINETFDDDHDRFENENGIYKRLSCTQNQNNKISKNDFKCDLSYRVSQLEKEQFQYRIEKLIDDKIKSLDKPVDEKLKTLNRQMDDKIMSLDKSIERRIRSEIKDLDYNIENQIRSSQNGKHLNKNTRDIDILSKEQEILSDELRSVNERLTNGTKAVSNLTSGNNQTMTIVRRNTHDIAEIFSELSKIKNNIENHDTIEDSSFSLSGTPPHPQEDRRSTLLPWSDPFTLHDPLFLTDHEHDQSVNLAELEHNQSIDEHEHNLSTNLDELEHNQSINIDEHEHNQSINIDEYEHDQSTDLDVSDNSICGPATRLSASVIEIQHFNQITDPNISVSARQAICSSSALRKSLIED